MNTNSKETRQGFINFFLETLENDSHNEESAKEFLKSEGVDTNKMLSEGLTRIKKMKLLIQAEKTKRDMEKAEAVTAQATEWVDNLLRNLDFSLNKLIHEEELTMSFRNVEKLGKDDIRNILIKHYILKFMNEKDKSQDGF